MGGKRERAADVFSRYETIVSEGKKKYK